MSAFVLNRNYELQLPNIFVDVDRNEMEYVDGGYRWVNYWWGRATNLTKDECLDFCDEYTARAVKLGVGAAAVAGALAWCAPAAFLCGMSLSVAGGNYGVIAARLNTASRRSGATVSINHGWLSVEIW